MFTFFADESYVDGGEAREYKLSIYGGLILDEDSFRKLTNFIYDLKDSYVYPQELELKWRFEKVWDNMRKIGRIDKSITKTTHPELFRSLKNDYDELKKKVLNEVSGSAAKIIIAVRPDGFLNISNRKSIEYSIGAAARKFEKLLEREGKFGIILADELPKKVKDNAVMDYEYIIQLCCRGSNAVSFHHLISIVPTINSNVSPIHQINDIVLGAVQYYILEFIRKINDPSRDMDLAKSLVTQFKDNFYKSIDNRYIINSGILLYPPKNTRRGTRAGIFLDKLEAQLKADFNII
ncbi:MAG: hypothetical protein WC450_12000 [Candidatus Omnitrophota bacterium]|jgi:hypothetical protein